MDLHQSSLLGMQLAELLEECQLDLDRKKWSTDVDQSIQMISKIVAMMHVHESHFQEQADKPISLDIVPSNGGLSLIEMGCSKRRLFVTKTSGNAQIVPTFDLMVQIPESALSGKDFMSYRYFDVSPAATVQETVLRILTCLSRLVGPKKRKVIMNCVARELSKQSHSVGDVDILWVNGCSRPPLLRVRSAWKRGAKFQLYLHFGMKSIHWIPTIRLAPNRSNVKASGAVAQLYNHSLLHDARHIFEDPDLCDLSEHQSCKAALILIKVWALQRGLWRNHDGWSETSVALLVVYLLRKNAMNPRMAPLQLFTIVLQTWASTNWLGDEKQNDNMQRAATGQDVRCEVNARRKRAVLIMPPGDNACIHQPTYSPLSDTDPRTLVEAYEYTDSYLLGPVFLDSSMSYNFLGGVSPNFMKLISLHAKKGLEDLNRSGSCFEILFMQRARFWQQWDLYFRVPTEVRKEKDWELQVRALLQKLEWGLGNRIQGVRVLSTGNGEFDCEESDSDQFPCAPVEQWMTKSHVTSTSPIGTDEVIIGVSIDHEICQRVVDRGPPSDRPTDASHFLSLWGDKAQLRRFKDGAIVYSVVWNEKHHSFQNNDKWGGGYVEDIVKYLVSRHHKCDVISISFRGMLSIIDTFSNSETAKSQFDPFAGHRNVMKAFEGLSTVLCTTSLSIPLRIDAVEPLSPALRYSELYPPMPHPILGNSKTSTKTVSGALMFNPILVQVKLTSSSKWPTDLKAIGAAKSAMLLQLAQSIEKCGDKGFDGILAVTTSHMYVGYKGYCFMLMIAPDAEMNLLRRLSRPSPSAIHFLKELEKKHVLASRHHSFVHSVHTLYPSSGSVVRLARRWADSHLLSGHLSTELIELLVAKVYSDSSVHVRPPCCVPVGFMRFLHLLERFDWVREPLVVDPRGHIEAEDYRDIRHVFNSIRRLSKDHGPPMYVIAPYNGETEDYKDDGDSTLMRGKWEPSLVSPESVVLNRVIYLSKRSRQLMHRCLVSFDDSDSLSVFRESLSSFKSYSLLMRVHEDFVSDVETSSTGGHLKVDKREDGQNESSFARSMAALAFGPRLPRQKGYRNLRQGSSNGVVPNWQPVRDLVDMLRTRFGRHAVFFYNQNCPEVICVLLRPHVFSPVPFSVMSSELSCPMGYEWQSGSLVARNLGDIVREMYEYSKDIVTHIRVFDESCLSHCSKRQKVDEYDAKAPEYSDS